ncbi:hypothetical protein SDC9_208410 [bioreactor metagenome]|uniref:Uncharacterized protein n=1 Tax=bioreactor metagenome TaxID=1076179 RepID=A0A645JDD3_9ZZZZ
MRHFDAAVGGDVAVRDHGQFDVHSGAFLQYVVIAQQIGRRAGPDGAEPDNADFYFFIHGRSISYMLRMIR